MLSEENTGRCHDNQLLVYGHKSTRIEELMHCTANIFSTVADFRARQFAFLIADLEPIVEIGKYHRGNVKSPMITIMASSKLKRLNGW
jgi:hypothetical protein